MRYLVAVVILVFLLFCTIAFVTATGPGGLPAPPDGAGGVTELHGPAPEWAGAKACAACHKELHETWSRTGHALTIRDFKPEMSAVPFDGGIFETRAIKHRMGPGPIMECEGPGGDRAVYPVGMVIGVRRVQMFTTSFGGGKIQVLPVFTEVPGKKWFDYADFIFGGPGDFAIEVDGPNSWYLHSRNFNSRCGRCHMTNYETGYDPDQSVYKTKWSEKVVACESCHGPGGKHIDKWRRLEDGPDPIINPSKLSIDRANQNCGFCHSENKEVVPGFRPGADLFRFVDVFALEDDKHLYPDGRARELVHNLVPIMESRCGPIACTKCHDPHGSGIPGDLYYTLKDDRTCTECHGVIALDLQAHTHHPVPSEGSRCVACHMPPLLIEGGHGTVRDHTISIPSPRNTRLHLSPNACRNCHMGEDPEGLERTFNRWYPGAEERNHRTKLAQTVAGGRAGRPEAEAPLLDLLQDKNPIYRAGAAWMLSLYDVDLTPLLEDAHPMVRRAALKAVGQKDARKLVPLLEEPNMVIRRAAALSLARRYEMVRADPALLTKLVATLDSFAQLKPDDAKLHGALAVLHELAEDIPQAMVAYGRYLRLNPWNKKIRDHLDKLTGTTGGSRK